MSSPQAKLNTLPSEALSDHTPTPDAPPPGADRRKPAKPLIDAAMLRDMAVVALSLLLGLVLWHLATVYRWNGFVNFSNVPTPMQVLTAFVANAGGAAFWTHIGVSIMRVAISFGLAALIGIPLGLAMGRSRLAHAWFMPYIEIFRPIPAVAWIPLAILMWPTQESSIVFITFLGAVFPIVLNTMQGARQAPDLLVRAVRSLGAGRAAVFRYVVVPAALPSIATGLAIGMGVAWFSLLAGEIISGQYGIGYFTWDAFSMVRTPDIVVGMLCIGMLGSVSTLLVHALTRPLLRWQRASA